MALKILYRPSFSSTVAINTAHLQGSLSVTFLALPNSELREIESVAAAAGKSTQQAVLHTVVKGHETIDMYGTPLEFTGPESLDKLLDVPGVGNAMLARYYAALWEQVQGN